MSDTPRPPAPEHLADEALLEWDRVCDELAAAGRLDNTDRAVLTLYVESWAIYHDMMRHVRQYGPIVKFSNGMPGQSPHFKTSREVAAQLRALLNDLGLTPLTRARVKATPAESSDDEF